MSFFTSSQTVVKLESRIFFKESDSDNPFAKIEFSLFMLSVTVTLIFLAFDLSPFAYSRLSSSPFIKLLNSLFSAIPFLPYPNSPTALAAVTNWSRFATCSACAAGRRFLGGVFSEAKIIFPSSQEIIFTRAIGFSFSRTRMQGHFFAAALSVSAFSSESSKCSAKKSARMWFSTLSTLWLDSAARRFNRSTATGSKSTSASIHRSNGVTSMFPKAIFSSSICIRASLFLGISQIAICLSFVG